MVFGAMGQVWPSPGREIDRRKEKNLLEKDPGDHKSFKNAG
jgi:hypothetical protein